MEQFLVFIESHGLPAFIIAISTIFILGVLKMCKVFSKIQNKNVRKSIYLVIDIVMAFAGTAIYYAIYHIAFNIEYLWCSLIQVGSTLSLYAVFENMHIRELVKKLLEWVVSWFKANPKALEKTLKKLGVPEYAITKIQADATAAIAAEKAKAQSTDSKNA